jgi:uncharacterized Zn finger protein
VTGRGAAGGTGRGAGGGTGRGASGRPGDFRDYGRPRRVDGGLKASTARGAIGKSWWSRRFLDVLESFALGTRLTRGRSYARSGQVLALDIAPGAVTASVQGSRPRPYAVRIGLPGYAEPVWERIEEVLAGQALFSARLLAGDLPPELEEVFAGAGAPLFPAAIGELDLRCDCPDFAVPCKHLAATFYLLAEAFDADPFQLLHWRGRDRAVLLARLRQRRTGASGPLPPTAPDVSGAVGAARPPQASGPHDGVGVGAGPRDGGVGSGSEQDGARAGSADRVLADLPDVPLADSVDRYWLPPVPLPARPPVLVTEPDLLLRQLGAPGATIGGPGLAERLRRAYQRFTAATD